ncbi:MAG: HEPN domain-containing protein [Bacteroidales bacterium]|nr:HEPN domain-containing protein [Bacteroidales bacterium]
MSLDKEKRDTVVSLEIAKAFTTQEEVDLLVEKGYWNAAANRLYYSVFHAVSALLIHDGIRIKSHKGAGIMLNQHYIQTNKISPELGKLYRRLELMREESDYNCFYNTSPEELKKELEPARELIDLIAKMVS